MIGFLNQSAFIILFQKKNNFPKDIDNIQVW